MNSNTQSTLIVTSVTTKAAEAAPFDFLKYSYDEYLERFPQGSWMSYQTGVSNARLAERLEKAAASDRWRIEELHRIASIH
jgi:hypothetical protein